MKNNMVLYGTTTYQEHTLEYYIVSEPISDTRADILRYGIRICKDNLQDCEILEIKNIFFDYNETTEFIDKMIKFKISPDNFVDVLIGYMMKLNKI